MRKKLTLSFYIGQKSINVPPTLGERCAGVGNNQLIGDHNSQSTVQRRYRAAGNHMLVLHYHSAIDALRQDVWLRLHKN
jgi:hypothetical protein